MSMRRVYIFLLLLLNAAFGFALAALLFRTEESQVCAKVPLGEVCVSGRIELIDSFTVTQESP